MNRYIKTPGTPGKVNYTAAELRERRRQEAESRSRRTGLAD